MSISESNIDPFEQQDHGRTGEAPGGAIPLGSYPNPKETISLAELNAEVARDMEASIRASVQNLGLTDCPIDPDDVPFHYYPKQFGEEAEGGKMHS